MKTLHRDNLTIKGDIADSNIEKVFELAKRYDWYTWAIDDWSQFKKAENMNLDVLEDLAALGVASLTNNSFDCGFGDKAPKTINTRPL